METIVSFHDASINCAITAAFVTITVSDVSYDAQLHRSLHVTKDLAYNS